MQICLVQKQSWFGVFRMRLKAIYAIFLLIMFSCSEPDLELDNDYDPKNPDFVAPMTIIQYVDDVISENEIEIFWDGNQVDMEFQTRLDNGDWSDWSNRKSETFSYLDEGIHDIFVKGKYTSGTVEDYPDTVSFEVDAISNNSLRIHPLRTVTTSEETFFIDIIAEDINENLAGAGITIKFSESLLSFAGDTLALGSFFSENDDNIIYFYSIEKTVGDIYFHLDIATIDDAKFFNGTGSIATLELKALSTNNDAVIQFIGETTTMRKANNNEININELVGGLIEIE
jgi:hypothetical protein